MIVVESKGPNQTCAAGSLRAIAVAADRDGFAQIVFADHDDETGLTQLVLSSTPLRALVTRQSFGAVEV